MATVNKNFKIKHGLVVEGSTATVNGQDILTETGGDTYILNLVGGATLVKSVSSDFAVDGSGNLTINGSSDLARSGDITTAINGLDTDDIEEGASNQYFTNQRALDATSAAYDAYGAAADVATDLSTHEGLTSGVHGVTGDVVGTTDTQILTNKTINDATFNVTVGLLPVQVDLAVISGATGNIQNQLNNKLEAADLTGYATETYVGTAIDNLVDGAPALLNTLNELAAAINDDANYTTTITTALGTKAPLASPALTGVPTAPTAAADTNTTQIATTAFAKAEADAAQAAAEATASADATSKADAAQAAAEGYADGLTDDMLDGTTAFTEINVNSEAKQIAATSASLGSVVVTAYQWPKADYRSGKFLVKIDNGTHNEVSEILVTLDSSDNVAITEYAIVGTNGSRGTITATVSGANVQLRVDPVNDSTIKVSGTLLK